MAMAYSRRTSSCVLLRAYGSAEGMAVSLHRACVRSAVGRHSLATDVAAFSSTGAASVLVRFGVE
jgi:hypothetical protein